MTEVDQPTQSVHFSSRHDEWETPKEFFDAQNGKWGFTIDVCATPVNAKCQRYFTRYVDGLSRSWAGERCWMNPPYGRSISRWMAKAISEAESGALVVCLVPVRTDTAWWHEYAMRGEITFIRGRLKFGGAKYNAPFPSALVVFGGVQ